MCNDLLLAADVNDSALLVHLDTGAIKCVCHHVCMYVRLANNPVHYTLPVHTC